MEIGIKQAKTDLSKLIEAAQAGQRIYLMNRGRRVAEVVPVSSEATPARGYGMYKGKVKLPKGWGSQKQREKLEREIINNGEDEG